MARSVSSTLETAIYAQQTNQVFHILLEIAHADMASTLRFVNNTANVTSNGDVYTAYPFLIDFPPADDPDQLPTVRLFIDNIDRSIVEQLRSISSAPTIDVSVVLASSPNTVECGPLQFTLRSIDYDAQVITAELGFENILNEPFPAGTFTPTDFPGLF